MKANEQFQKLDPSFWAAVRIISQQVGYTVRREKRIKVPTLNEIIISFDALGLNTTPLGSEEFPTAYASRLYDYFAYRANWLDNYVEPRLMDATRAESVFTTLRQRLNPTCPLPMNKQRGHKKAPAYFTGIINMLIEEQLAGKNCDYDPRQLVSITQNGIPLRTLSRRVDGAYPSPINPMAVWEIKEYYYTTTFGSRVADGVYETLLDGLELKELEEHENRKVHHYLMVDSHNTWWNMGRSYLCRIVDMLNMGLVDEVLFGYEVVERLPAIVQGWQGQHEQL